MPIASSSVHTYISWSAGRAARSASTVRRFVSGTEMTCVTPSSQIASAISLPSSEMATGVVIIASGRCRLGHLHVKDARRMIAGDVAPLFGRQPDQHLVEQTGRLGPRALFVR